MIYTITLNPSIDLKMSISELGTGRVNRAEREWMSVGGKGINVSCILTRLGVKNIAVAPVAGFVGREIENIMCKMGMECDFIRFDTGCSRINVKLCAGEETEINAKGPDFGAESEQRISERISACTREDFVVLSGSAADDGIYARLAANTEARVVVDADGELLKKSIYAKPYLIKPNIDEASALLSQKIENFDDVCRAARSLREMGAENVIVSMGGDGAVLCTKDDKIMYCTSSKGRIVSTTGAGDSLLGGFLAGIVNGFAPEDALKLGVAAGSATAFAENLAEKEDILALYNNAEKRIN